MTETLEFSEENVVVRFAAAMQQIPKTIKATSSTEFKQKTVGINDFMAAVAGPLRDHGLLIKAELQDFGTAPMLTTSFVVDEGPHEGTVVENVRNVVEFGFSMNIIDFAGNKLWPDESWVAVQRNLDSDQRPEFWPAKALSYAIKYWLARRLGIDLGETAADPDLDQVQTAPVRKQAGRKKAASRKQSAKPKESEWTWTTMHDRFVQELGREAADEFWGDRRKTDEPLTAAQAETALDTLTGLRREQQVSEGAEPFEVLDSDAEVTAGAVAEEASKLLFSLATAGNDWVTFRGAFTAMPHSTMLGDIPDELMAYPDDTPLQEIASAVADWLDSA